MKLKPIRVRWRGAPFTIIDYRSFPLFSWRGRVLEFETERAAYIRLVAINRGKYPHLRTDTVRGNVELPTSLVIGLFALDPG